MADSGSTLAIGYDDIQLEIFRYLGYDADSTKWSAAMVAEVDRYIQAGYRQFLYPPAMEGVETGYEWSFLKPTTTINTIQRYTTGDVAVVSGTCTLTDGTWPSWAYTHGTLVIDDDEYSITSRDGDTQLTVVGDDVEADDGDWYLKHSGNQDLPDDCGRIIGNFHFKADVYPAKSIPVVSEHMIQTLLQSSIDESRPQYAAVRFKSSDGSDGQKQEVVWYPIPDDVYTMTYRYEAFTGKLTTDNPYPLGGMKHSEVIMESCLAIAEQRGNDEKSFHWDSFSRLLATAIAQDRKNGAKYFGPMSTGEEPSYPRRRFPYQTSYEITYDGETW